MKHYTIPVFVPELACPNQCVYCNQHRISGQLHIPKAEEVKTQIKSYLLSFPKKEKHIQIGFFGGNFTGIPWEEQKMYLEIAAHYLQNGQVQGIRLSTRPDYITPEILDRLKEYGVNHIELGAQSTNDHVLKLSGRGHQAEQIFKASKLIRQYGFTLGLQMMLGLPGSSKEIDIQTAHDIINLKATDTRIYPCLVIKDTQLYQDFQSGNYQTLSLEDAVERAAEISGLFEKAEVKIIRMGLHASEGLRSGEDFASGPFHPSFRELVYSKIWHQQFLLIENKTNRIEIEVSPAEINYAIGYQSENKKRLLKRFDHVKFIPNHELKERNFILHYHQ